MNHCIMEVQFKDKDKALEVAGLLLNDNLAADIQLLDISTVFILFNSDGFDEARYLLRITTRGNLYWECAKIIRKHNPDSEHRVVAYELRYVTDCPDWICTKTKKGEG